MAKTIDLRAELRPRALHGLAIIITSGEWKGIHLDSIGIVDLVYFSEHLKTVGDTEEFFPAGKWATIQRLQQIIQDNK